MLASVLICTSNRAEMLRQTLQSLAAVSVPPTLPAELIVIDNGSTDATAKVVRSCNLANLPVRYVWEPRRGKGHAYNAGIAAAQGQMLVWTDDDVRLPANWLTGMCAPILSGTAHAVQGGVRLAPHLERPWLSKELRWLLACTEGLNPEAPRWAVGANMAFSREVLTQVPGFDPELGPGALGLEDESLFFRQLRKAGYRVATALDVVVEHHCEERRLLRSGFLNAARQGGRSLAYFEYHWEHITEPAPYRQLLRLLVRLARYRIWHGRRLYLQGIPSWEEVQLVKAISFCRQYLRERTRPRAYEKHGLVKLAHVMPALTRPPGPSRPTLPSPPPADSSVSVGEEELTG